MITPTFLGLGVYYATQFVWILYITMAVMLVQLWQGFAYAAAIALLERRRRLTRAMLHA